MRAVRTLLDRLTPTIEERFWSKVDKGSDCWTWTGYLRDGKYGAMKVRGDLFMAHRVAWVIAHRSDVPDGLVLDHLCRNTRCVNPGHLEPVTDRVNLLRGETFNARQAAQTHCKLGHALAGDNVYAGALARGIRHCKTCNRERRAAARIREKVTA